MNHGNRPETDVDVLIVGAGMSGINAAYHLTHQCPDTRFVLLETFESFGGTWWSHRYPGIRSDSDLYTFGYRFKPWVGPPIATGEEILAYMAEVIEENDLARHIRYGHRITHARWCSDAARWTVTATDLAEDREVTLTARFLYMGAGYYRHQEGHWPDWPDADRFEGTLVHSEEWPEDLDLTGRRVVVIGSGASAATIVPSICDTAAGVTMLQRSPTFYRTGRNAIAIADHLRTLGVDESWIHEITRRQILFEGATFTARTFSEPDAVRRELIGEVRRLLGSDFDVARHFTPSYRPWRQRIAFVPDADLFHAIAGGQAAVVTDEIERFVPTGIQLKSGARLEADVIVAATGFNMNALGDIVFEVDGTPLDFHDTLTYRGMMFTGLPNLVMVFGYLRASWTLRADLVADFFCRMLRHMDGTGADSVSVKLPADLAEEPHLDWITSENFNANYIRRGLHLMPRAVDHPDWQHSQDYWQDKDSFPLIDLDAPAFRYGRRGVAGSGQAALEISS